MQQLRGGEVFVDHGGHVVVALLVLRRGHLLGGGGRKLHELLSGHLPGGHRRNELCELRGGDIIRKDGVDGVIGVRGVYGGVLLVSGGERLLWVRGGDVSRLDGVQQLRAVSDWVVCGNVGLLGVHFVRSRAL